MKQYVKQFFARGFAFAGLGPLVCAIVLFIVDITTGATLSGSDVCLAVFSTYLLAFVQAGASVFNQIEEWPIAKSLFFHFFSIYAVYVFVYLINAWIPRLPIVVAIFTGIFIVTYAVVWLTVYLCVRAHAKRLNARL